MISRMEKIWRRWRRNITDWCDVSLCCGVSLCKGGVLPCTFVSDSDMLMKERKKKSEML
jgi:hypothetical protein